MLGAKKLPTLHKKILEIHFYSMVTFFVGQKLYLGHFYMKDKRALRHHMAEITSLTCRG